MRAVRQWPPRGRGWRQGPSPRQQAIATETRPFAVPQSRKPSGAGPGGVPVGLADTRSPAGASTSPSRALSDNCGPQSGFRPPEIRPPAVS